MEIKSNLSKEALELARECSHKVWQPYDDTYGYRTEKQERNASVSTDNPDNIWFFLGQFDLNNQSKLYFEVIISKESKAKEELATFIKKYLEQEIESLRDFYIQNENNKN